MHRFSRDGEFLASWGESGDGPGQFNVPHGIGCDGHKLYVADRENSRVQIFSFEGELLAIWNDLARPAQVLACDDLVYVFELGFHTGMFPWQSADPAKPGGRLSIFDSAGDLQTRWGGDGGLACSDPSLSPDEFYAPHDLALDSAGNIYTAEVKSAAAEISRSRTRQILPSLRKFERISIRS